MTGRLVVGAAAFTLAAAVCPMGAGYLLICAGHLDQRIRRYLEARRCTTPTSFVTTSSAISGCAG